MKLILAALTIAGCQPLYPSVPAPAPVAQYPKRAEPDPGPPPELQKPQRNETVEVTNPIAGVTIALVPTPRQAAAWDITVTNDTEAMASVVWDESTFVGADGRSWGRLIPGSTRRMDVGHAHPPAPLAPHAAMTETAIPELSIDMADIDGLAGLLAAHGGRMVVVIDLAGAKKAWQATIVESQ